MHVCERSGRHRPTCEEVPKRYFLVSFSGHAGDGKPRIFRYCIPCAEYVTKGWFGSASCSYQEFSEDEVEVFEILDR